MCFTGVFRLGMAVQIPPSLLQCTVDMTDSPRETKQTIKSPRSAAILLLLTIADTTWRAFVPTIGGTVLGVTLDNTLQTAPGYTTVLIIAGFVTSIVLVALQIRKVRRS